MLSQTKQKNHLNSIEQYLRINNLEIVGLPEIDVDNGEIVEETLINVFNSLPEIEISARAILTSVTQCHQTDATGKILLYANLLVVKQNMIF